jgi:hypothetical protein
MKKLVFLSLICLLSISSYANSPEANFSLKQAESILQKKESSNAVKNCYLKLSQAKKDLENYKDTHAGNTCMNEFVQEWENKIEALFEKCRALEQKHKENFPK